MQLLESEWMPLMLRAWQYFHLMREVYGEYEFCSHPKCVYKHGWDWSTFGTMSTWGHCQEGAKKKKDPIPHFMQGRKSKWQLLDVEVHLVKCCFLSSSMLPSSWILCGLMMKWVVLGCCKWWRGDRSGAVLQLADGLLPGKYCILTPLSTSAGWTKLTLWTPVYSVCNRKQNYLLSLADYSLALRQNTNSTT